MWRTWRAASSATICSGVMYDTADLLSPSCLSVDVFPFMLLDARPLFVEDEGRPAGMVTPGSSSSSSGVSPTCRGSVSIRSELFCRHSSGVSSTSLRARAMRD